MTITTGIFLLNIKGEILLVHPTNASWKNWSIPKGLPDENEKLIDAAKRELKEETNIDFDQLKIAYLYESTPVNYKSGKKRLMPFFAKVVSGIDEIELKCNSLVEGKNFKENDQITWFPFEEAKKIMHETQVKAFNEFVMKSVLR